MASALSLIDEVPATLSVLELPLHEDGPCGFERRSQPRASAEFTVRPCDGEEEYRGIDLSFGGLMCAGNEPLWPGNSLWFNLSLPGESRTLRVQGRVVDLVGYRGQVAMRVRFDDIDFPSRKRIATWMSRVRNV
jgi:hypothetical protein